MMRLATRWEHSLLAILEIGWLPLFLFQALYKQNRLIYNIQKRYNDDEEKERDAAFLCVDSRRGNGKKVLLICFNAEIKDGGVFVLYVKKEAE